MRRWSVGGSQRTDQVQVQSGGRQQRSVPRIVIAGAPAAGKGTQCEIIKSEFGVVHLSTGDILRAAVKEGTELGIKAKSYMDSGQLVPDEIMTDIVCTRLSQEDCVLRGWLLDGYPRTKRQADALERAGLVADCVILLDVPEDVLAERVTGRRTDPVTGNIYHLQYNPPPCEEIAHRLQRRSDDTLETVARRYHEFLQHVEDIKAAYESSGVTPLLRVDGAQPKELVAQTTLKLLRSTLREKYLRLSKDKNKDKDEDMAFKIRSSL